MERRTMSWQRWTSPTMDLVAQRHNPRVVNATSPDKLYIMMVCQLTLIFCGSLKFSESIDLSIHFFVCLLDAMLQIQNTKIHHNNSFLYILTNLFVE